MLASVSVSRIFETRTSKPMRRKCWPDPPKIFLRRLPPAFAGAWEWRPLSLGRPRQMGTKGEKKMYRNHVELIGFLGSDAETKTTPNGRMVTALSLATKTTYKKDGERQERTEWHRIECWGRLAEYAAAF